MYMYVYIYINHSGCLGMVTTTWGTRGPTNGLKTIYALVVLSFSHVIPKSVNHRYMFVLHYLRLSLSEKPGNPKSSGESSLSNMFTMNSCKIVIPSWFTMHLQTKGHVVALPEKPHLPNAGPGPQSLGNTS